MAQKNHPHKKGYKLHRLKKKRERQEQKQKEREARDATLKRR